MKQRLPFLIPALVAAAVFAASGSAAAGNFAHERHSGGSTRFHSSVQASHDSHGGHGSGKRHHRHRRHDLGHDRHGSYHRDRHDCRKVAKHGYHHGRKAKIGGVMCHDRYGYPYIVAGSRYVIHYY